MKILYFGCYRDKGHYFWSEGFSKPRWSDTVTQIPWGIQVDTGLCPKGPQIQGRAAFHQKDGWTAISFWDRTVDTRPGSHSTFLCENTLDFDAMVALCKETFPTIWERYTFEVVLNK